MRLSDTINESCIRAGGTPFSKEEALREIAALACECGGIEGCSESELFEALRRREKIGSTGFGRGIAIPHCGLEKIDRFVTGILIVPGGVDFDALDGKPVRVLFFIIGPASMRNRHIQILSSVSKLLSDEHTVQRLADAGNKKTIMETVCAAVNPVLQHEYLKRCAELTGLPEEALRAELRRRGKGRSRLADRTAATEQAHHSAERELVALAIHLESVGRALRERITATDLEDADCRELLEIVFQMLDETDAVTTEALLRRVERPELARLVSEIALEGARAEPSEKLVEELVGRVLKPRHTAKLKELKEQIDQEGRAGPVSPELIGEYQALRAKVRHWRSA